MSSLFDHKKTAQAAAFLLEREPQRQTEYLRLLKLLYIADREVWKEKRRGIIHDDVYAMKLGPVLSATFDDIKVNDIASEWGELIEKDGYDARLRQHPVPTGRLSKYERRKLQEVSDRYSGVDWKTLSDLTHQFPEWNDPGDTSVLIPLQRILRAIGLEAEMNEILAEHANRTAMADLLSEKKT